MVCVLYPMRLVVHYFFVENENEIDSTTIFLALKCGVEEQMNWWMALMLHTSHQRPWTGGRKDCMMFLKGTLMICMMLPSQIQSQSTQLIYRYTTAQAPKLDSEIEAFTFRSL